MVISKHFFFKGILLVGSFMRVFMQNDEREMLFFGHCVHIFFLFKLDSLVGSPNRIMSILFIFQFLMRHYYLLFLYFFTVDC